jgi:thiol:disulfide interchange protein DsbA
MNRRDALKLAGLAFALPAASIARADEPFQIIEPAQKADDPSKIEVLEFFHYGCPHCRDFHPLITAWKKKLPADVAFRAVPAVWNNAQLGGLARLYYTAEITGDLAALEPAIFAAVQDDKRPLFNEQQVGEWIAARLAMRRNSSTPTSPSASAPWCSAPTSSRVR